MKTILLIVASVLTIGSIIPYARDILKGTTKPNIVSWITWSLLTAVATLAELSDHQYVTAIYTGSAVLETSIIVIMGFKYGYVKYTKFDVVCQVSAIIGIGLWQLFDSPLLGVVASMSIDFIGALPTIRHSWVKPGEETLVYYIISGLGAVFAVAALTKFTWVSLTYPVYIVLLYALLAGVIITRN